MNRDTQALRGPDCLSHSHNPDLESRHRKPGHPNQFVGRLKGIENSRQAQIKDAIESKDIHTHGKYDTKYGILAYGKKKHRVLNSEEGLETVTRFIRPHQER
jgi:hypothetical protein